MKQNLKNGEAIEILCHNSATKQNEWKPGTFISYCPATDIDFRIECKLESGQHLQGITAAHPDCVRSLKLNSVIVHFEDSQYDYETNVSAKTTEESAKKYFVGASFNMASYPKEIFKKCISITFIDNNKDNTKSFKIHFEGRKVGAIGKLYNFTEKIQSENLDLAILKLYDNYEHIRVLTVNGEKFDYNTFTPTYGGMKLV